MRSLLFFVLLVSCLFLFSGCSFQWEGPKIRTDAYNKSEGWQSRQVAGLTSGTNTAPKEAWTFGNVE